MLALNTHKALLESANVNDLLWANILWANTTASKVTMKGSTGACYVQDSERMSC